MMGEINGFQVMEYAATHTPDTLVIVITGYASSESAIEALRKGAYDYVTKPFEVEMILITVARAMEKVRLQRQLTQRMGELEQSNQQLSHSLHELKTTQERLIQTEKLSALGELIAGFAHELNNPLSAVLGYSELLVIRERSAAEVCMMLNKIRQEAVRCHQIVQNLLTFARQQKPLKSFSNLTAICLRTLDLLAYQLKVNNVHTVTHLPTDLPETMADEHQLQQVLINIISNAYQAVAEHHGRGQLTLRTFCDDTMLYVQVSDTGPGITSEHLQHIFDPFYTTKQHGTGLGLSLSYGVIKEHGGDISVESTLGVGTTFTISLPIIAPDTPALPPSTAVPTSATAAKRVLVVDDEQNVALMVVTLLQSLGHQAEATFSGREAMEKIDRESYDMVICDLKMPEVDGRQIYQFINAHHPALLKRLLFVSGDTMSEKYRTFLHDSGCPVLQKPFLVTEFKQAIQHIEAATTPAIAAGNAA